MIMYKSLNFRAIGMAVDAAATIEIAAETGFEAVDLMVRDLLEKGLKPSDLRSSMNAFGLRAATWPMPVRWRGDEEVFESDLLEFQRFSQAAEVLGLEATSTWILPEALPARTREQSLEIQRRRIERMCRILADHGMRLGIEVLGPKTCRTGLRESLAEKLSDAWTCLGDLWTTYKNLGIVADVFHLHAADESFDECLALGVDRIVVAHIADLRPGFRGSLDEIIDGERELPGKAGIVDSARFLDLLAKSKYEGPVIAEPLQGCPSLSGLSPVEAAVRLRQSLESVWPKIAPSTAFSEQ